MRALRFHLSWALLALAFVLQTVVAWADNPSIVPSDRLSKPWWAERHTAVLEALRARPDTQLLMIGDSITNNYDKAAPPDENFQPVWKQFYEPRKALNLGFSGDTTANVLWRLQHGEIEGIDPKVAVLLIGTNNTWHEPQQTAEQTATGIDAIVAELEQRLPRTRILVLGILPSEVSDAKTVEDRKVNQYLATAYGENPRVTFLDISAIFYQGGTLNQSLFYDLRLAKPGKAVHPDTNGQRMMAEAIEPTLARLMGDEPRAALDSMTDINTALIPVDRLEQDSYDWYARHHIVLQLQKSLKPHVVLVGDSITHFWGGQPAANHVNGPAAWERVFGKRPVLNMGFGWDRTQNVLWRLRQGEFEGLNPKWIVLNIGTNNLTGTSHARASTPEELVEAIGAITAELHQRSPRSRILLMSLFPRGAEPNHPLRAPIEQTNRLLAQHFAHDPLVKVIDIGAAFLAPDGSLPATLMPDGTHPDDAGYQIWADALIKAGVRP